MKRMVWIPIFAALILYGVVLYLTHPNPKAQLDTTPGSSTSANPSGDLAFALLWERLGVSFRINAQIPSFLGAANGQVFVSVEPQSGTYSTKDVQALLQWAAKGNRVVWVTASTDKFVEAFHANVESESATPVTKGQWRVRTSTSVSGTPDTQSSKTSAASLSNHAGNFQSQVPVLPNSDTTGGSMSDAPGSSNMTNLHFTASKFLEGQGLHQAVEQFVAGNGQTLGAVWKYGHGDVVIWSTPSVWENQSIGTGDNLKIAWQILDRRPVIWDEYGHGVVSQSLLGTMFGHGNESVLVMLLLTLVIFAAASLPRFGRIRRAPEESPRLETELITALAWHYGHRRFKNYRYRLFDAAVRRRFGKVFGLGTQPTWDHLDATVPSLLPPALAAEYATWREAGDSGAREGPSGRNAASQSNADRPATGGSSANKSRSKEGAQPQRLGRRHVQALRRLLVGLEEWQGEEKFK